MREMINYIIEANAALLLFLVLHQCFLKHETNFRFVRFYLLGAIFISILFPLIHLNTSAPSNIPSIGQAIPEYWLPEIVIGGQEGAPQQILTNKAYNMWQLAGWFYLLGVLVFLIWLVMQLGYVWIMLRNAISYKIESFRIIESPEDKPTFSFFNLIYIGRSDELTSAEKEHIIRHERVHAQQLHSVDILIVTFLGIIFWFNPFIKIYKKILIQLHEFEADARAVENSDVNMYCSLLARVALQSHFPIASHFNESLTVKRIEMMRTIKKKIGHWKIFALTLSVFVCFFVIACQDQVMEEFEKSTISQTEDYPDDVKIQMANYLKEHPNSKLTYMEGEGTEVDKFKSTEQVASRVVYTYTYKKNGGNQKKGVLLTDVVEHAESLANNDKVFMVVEKMPEYVGGFDAMKAFMFDNMKHPSDGKTGTVYVSMVIGTDGQVSDVNVLRGVGPAADAEALRVVKMMPNWIPGEQSGKKVKVRYVLPIRFGGNGNEVGEAKPDNYKMKIDYAIKRSGNEIIISGAVVSAKDNKKLSGVNLVIAGSTYGTTTDSEGRFTIKAEQPGKLVATFVGFDYEEIKFQ